MGRHSRDGGTPPPPEPSPPARPTRSVEDTGALDRSTYRVVDVGLPAAFPFGGGNSTSPPRSGGAPGRPGASPAPGGDPGYGPAPLRPAPPRSAPPRSAPSRSAPAGPVGPVGPVRGGYAAGLPAPDARPAYGATRWTGVDDTGPGLPAPGGHGSDPGPPVPGGFRPGMPDTGPLPGVRRSPLRDTGPGLPTPGPPRPAPQDTGPGLPPLGGGRFGVQESTPGLHPLGGRRFGVADSTPGLHPLDRARAGVGAGPDSAGDADAPAPGRRRAAGDKGRRKDEKGRKEEKSRRADGRGRRADDTGRRGDRGRRRGDPAEPARPAGATRFDLAAGPREQAPRQEASRQEAPRPEAPRRAAEPRRAAARVEDPVRRGAGPADRAGPDTVGSTALAPRRLPPEPDEVTDTGARRTRSTFHVATAADAAPLDEHDDYDEDESSLLLQWGIFLAQTLTGAAVGLGVWLGFYRLWSTWPLYAAPAVGVVMIAMLVGGRTLRRRHGSDLDLLTAVLAIAVGTVLTVLPAAFTLQGVA